MAAFRGPFALSSAGWLAVSGDPWWPPPAQLVAVMGILLAGAGFTVWVIGRRAHLPPARRLALAVVVGLVAVTALVAGLFRVDRAGWLWSRVTGYDMVRSESLADEVHRPLAELTRAVPFIAADPGAPGQLVIPAGTHDVLQTVVIPAGTSLRIAPGAILRFAAGRSLVAYSPILARGTPDQPIVFTARRPWLKWGAIAVVDAGPSAFANVRVEQGRYANVNGITFPGTLSLIHSDGSIGDSEFHDLFGKDAIYVQGGRVTMHDSAVHDVAQDGLDLDDGRGEVSRNRFVNCGDEGIDLTSTLELRVFDNTILDARGGRISADTGLEELKAANTLGYSRGG